MRETYRLYHADTTAASTCTSIDVRDDGVIEELCFDAWCCDETDTQHTEFELSFASTCMSATNDTRQVIHTCNMQTAATDGAANVHAATVRNPMIQIYAGERLYLHQTNSATPGAAGANCILVVAPKGKSSGRDSRGRFNRRES